MGIFDPIGAIAGAAVGVVAAPAAAAVWVGGALVGGAAKTGYDDQVAAGEDQKKLPQAAGSAEEYDLDATTDEFLKSGEKSGKWFTVPDEVKQKAKERGPEFERRIHFIEAWMDQLNDTLARTDLTDTEKKALLTEFFSGTHSDLDDDKKSTIGWLISAVSAKDWASLEPVFNRTRFCGGLSLDDERCGKLNDLFTSSVEKWKSQNNIQRPPDTAWIKRWKEDNDKAAEYRKTLAEQTQERLARLKAEDDARTASRRA